MYLLRMAIETLGRPGGPVRPCCAGLGFDLSLEDPLRVGNDSLQCSYRKFHSREPDWLQSAGPEVRHH